MKTEIEITWQVYEDLHTAVCYGEDYNEARQNVEKFINKMKLTRRDGLSTRIIETLN